MCDLPREEFDESIAGAYPHSSGNSASRPGHNQAIQGHNPFAAGHNQSTTDHIWYSGNQDKPAVSQNSVEPYLASRQYSAFQSVSKSNANHHDSQLVDEGRTSQIRDQPSGESKPTTPSTEPAVMNAESRIISTNHSSTAAPTNEMDQSTAVVHVYPEFHLSNPRDAHFYNDIIKSRPKIASRKLEKNKHTRSNTDSALSHSDSPVSSSTSSRVRNKSCRTDLHQSPEFTPTPPPLPKKQRSVKRKDRPALDNYTPDHAEQYRDSVDGSHLIDRVSDRRSASPNERSLKSGRVVQDTGSAAIDRNGRNYIINMTSSSSDVTPPIRSTGPVRGHHSSHLQQETVSGPNANQDSQAYRKPSPGSSRRSSSSTERSYKAQLESAQRVFYDPASVSYKPPSPNYTNQSPSTNSNINQSPRSSSKINQSGSNYTEQHINDQSTSTNQGPTISLGMTHHASYIPSQQESSSPTGTIAARAARRLSMPTAYEYPGTKQEVKIRQEMDDLQNNEIDLMAAGDGYSEETINRERSIMETSIYDNDRCTTPSLPALTDTTDIDSMISSYHAVGKKYPYQRSSSVNERLLFSDIHQPQLDGGNQTAIPEKQPEHGDAIEPGELYIDVNCTGTRGEVPTRSPLTRGNTQSRTRKDSQSHTRASEVAPTPALESKIAKIEQQLGNLVSFLAGTHNAESKRSSMTDSMTSSQYSHNPSHHSRRYRAHRGRSMESKANNKRFQRIESHIVTLARSIEHISKEMRSFNTLYLEVESLSAKVDGMHQANHTANTQPSLTANAAQLESNGEATLRASECKSNTQRISKLTKFFGQEPPMMGLFLKQLGYEQYTELFESEKIGMLELPFMTEEKLRSIGVPLGPRTRILEEAQDLRLNMTPIHIISKRQKHRTSNTNKS